MPKAVRIKRAKALYVSSSIAKILSDYLLKKGMDKQRLNETLECCYDELDTSDFRLKISSYQALWSMALEYTQEPALGLKLAQNPYNDEMGLVAHIFFNSPTLLLGLKQYERYYSLVNEGMHIELETDDHFAYINYISDFDDAYCQADMEHTLAISILRVKQNISESLDLEFVHFQHSEPEDISLYQEIFPCPIKFGQACCALIFKKEYLDYNLPKHSAYLYKLLTHHIESLLKKIRPTPTFTNKVKELLEKHLSKDAVDAEHIAKKLFMSRHTLYRRLKQEGISFHDLLDQIREEKAYFYLDKDKDKHSLSEIAFLLGFSELSAFSRAFKRWSGVSPANYVKDKNK
jgi:AraC-like DNA-binding protein